MEINEAIKNINQLEESLRAIRLNTQNINDYKNRNEKLNETINKERKEKENFRNDYYRYKRYYELLKDNSTVKICEQCDGIGGFDWEDGYGGGGSEPCNQCESVGIINK